MVKECGSCPVALDWPEGWGLDRYSSAAGDWHLSHFSREADEWLFYRGPSPEALVREHLGLVVCEECALLRRLGDGEGLRQWRSARGRWHLRLVGGRGVEFVHGETLMALLAYAAGEAP